LWRQPELSISSNGFEVTNTQTLNIEGERVSSTRIRQALGDGDLDLAESLLGYRYQIAGRVVYGQQLGRQLGVPTANVQLNRCAVALSGVFAVSVIVDGQCFEGVANIGMRPTVGGLQPVLEAHLLAFSGDLYGQRIAVVFESKIRDEQKFDSLDALKAQIFDDIACAQRFFNGRNG